MGGLWKDSMNNPWDPRGAEMFGIFTAVVDPQAHTGVRSAHTHTHGGIKKPE